LPEQLSILSIIYAERFNLTYYAACHYAECRQAECHNADSRGTSTEAKKIEIDKHSSLRFNSFCDKGKSIL
jgi:hypothetical protein